MNSFTKIVTGNILHLFGDASKRLSIILLLIIIFIATNLLSINVIDTTYDYRQGDIAREDIKAHKEVNYINEPETEMEKKRAAETVPLVFDKDASVLLEKLKLISVLFDHIAVTLTENPPIGTNDLTFQLFSLKKRLPSYLQYNDNVLLEMMKYPAREDLKKSIHKILIYIYDNNEMGLLDKEFRSPPDITSDNITVRIINYSDIREEVSKNIYNLETMDTIAGKLYNICYSTAPNLPRPTLNAVVTIVMSQLKANLTFNLEETKRRINERVLNVKPVMGIIKKGQIIVREGDTITTDILNKIHILNKNAEKSNLSFIFGTFLLQLVFLVIFGYFITRYKKIFIVDKESSIIVFSLLLIFMLYTYFIAQTQSKLLTEYRFIFFLPIPFITMMVSILYNVYLAMMIGVYVVFFTSSMIGGDLVTVIISFSSALLGVLVCGDIEKRTDVIRGGFIIGIINAVIITAIGLMKGILFIDIVKNIHIPIANGVFNSILVLGIFPVYESIFGITTRFKLHELSDLNADIFKKMLVHAPGTYNHSLIVSTMAETACNDIEANHLLARVGSFYHDIGKIEDSGIYIENKLTDPRSKHLSSTEYSRLIISHVEKGVNLARQYRLPVSVINFIREHHGTSIMTYFYHQALENASTGSTGVEILKEDFQYPGPKPQSKETAIVMLADAIEAASRSIKNPTSASMEGLVKKIIFNKLNDGELESSELSMSELKLVEKAFLKILNGIFHTRIEYPDAEDVRVLEKKLLENGKGKPGGPIY